MNKNVLIIHLSDIHIKDNQNEIEKRINSIYEALRNEARDSICIFLVISGDIANKGQVSEYAKSTDIIRELIQLIEEYCRKKVNCILIAGNHDCNFNIENNVIRNNLIKNFSIDNYDAEDLKKLISFCNEVHNNYNEFSCTLMDQNKVINKNPMLKLVEYNVNGIKIVFQCFNTAWNSLIHDTRNKFIPVELVSEISQIESSLSISVIHHPFNWFDEHSHREFRNLLREYSDITISGHEHISDQSVFDNLRGKTNLFIEGDILQSNSSSQSGFNLIKINLNSKEYEVSNYKYDQTMYRLNFRSEKFKLSRSLRSIAHKYIMKQFFKNKLKESGASFRHPKKEQLTLGDIYIFPALKEINLLSANESSINTFINAEELILSRMSSDFKLLFVGESVSGKTSLLKNIVTMMYDENFLPVLIKGKQICKLP